MGLDITVVTKWAYAETPSAEQEEEWGSGPVRLYLTPDFPEQSQDLRDGYIDIEASWGFRAGRYSWHSTFREHLCQAANGFSVQEIWVDPEGEREALFWELLNFSDCEGTLGPAACAACAADMDNYLNRGVHEKYLEGLEPDLAQGFDDTFQVWRRAFSETSEGGLIILH